MSAPPATSVSLSLLTLIVALPLFLDVKSLCKAEKVRRSDICDNGEYMIDKDRGGEENWRCQSEEFVVTQFMEPAGDSLCRETVEPIYQCMEKDLSYPDHPPSSGDFRPVAPKYGEYKYLPPQRWLHTLERGGLAFLYHPCAPPDQVLKLKELARSCLWRHVITPYPHLNKSSSLAIVSWGCVYHMSWVNAPEAKLWIREHALKAEGSLITTDGPEYDEGLLRGADPAIGGHVCGERVHSSNEQPPPDVSVPGPDHPNHVDIDPSNQPKEHDVDSDHGVDDEAAAPPCKSNSTKEPSDQQKNLCPQSTIIHPAITIHTPHRSTLTLLIVLLSVVLCVALLVGAWRLCVATRNGCGRKKQARYKSVSKFFPFSYGHVDAGNDVAIPEYGLPKNRAAEREILLNDSDEDEL